MSGKYDRVDWIGGFPYEFADFDVLVTISVLVAFQ